VVAETVGAIVGFAVWIVYRHEFEAILQRTATSAAARPAVFAALVVYTALFIAAHVYPLDLTADIGQLGRKYRDGRINFIPFSTPIGAAQLTKSVAAAFPIGAAAATIAGTLPTLALWLLTVAVLAIVELSQVLVRSQASDVTDILTGSVGTFLGICAARALFQDRKTARPRSAARAPFVRRLFPFAWIAIVAAVQWWPLQFRGDPEFLRERVLKMVSSPYVLVGMSWTLLLGLSLGLVLATAWPSRRDCQFPRVRVAALAMVACSTLAAIEFGQLFVPARHPHPSNVVAGAIGVLLGLRVERVTARFGH
jgi:glycopeptide antibiotics resistance protein